MRFLLFSIILLFSFTIEAQEISEINKILEIPDTLEFEKEIRIYKDYTTTNSVKFFRMYDKGNDTWIAYEYWYSKSFKDVTKISGIEFPKENIGKLKPKNAYLIWLNLLLCDVEYLPNQKNIDYKLKSAIIVSEAGEYGVSKNKKHSLDGEFYKVFIKNGINKNDFSFSNPFFYLKFYPTVDELISYNELLSIIEKEFHFFND
ncbi:hypothetical protein AB9T88_04335 [Flavobacterium sp. LBUM151]